MERKKATPSTLNDTPTNRYVLSLMAELLRVWKQHQHRFDTFTVPEQLMLHSLSPSQRPVHLKKRTHRPQSVRPIPEETGTFAGQNVVRAKNNHGCLGYTLSISNQNVKNLTLAYILILFRSSYLCKESEFSLINLTKDKRLKSHTGILTRPCILILQPQNIHNLYGL